MQFLIIMIIHDTRNEFIRKEKYIQKIKIKNHNHLEICLKII